MPSKTTANNTFPKKIFHQLPFPKRFVVPLFNILQNEIKWHQVLYGYRLQNALIKRCKIKSAIYTSNQ
jgi:hypothetical protein